MHYHTQHLRLTDQERETLRQCEDDLGRTFVTQGRAMKTIRDDRLYREEFDTFEDYCQERWEMNRGHANRLIAAAEALDTVTPMGSKQPETERQLRPLTTLRDAAGKMDPEKQQAAWAQAVYAAGDGPVTAKIVEEAVIAVREGSRPEPKPTAAPEENTPDLPDKKYRVFLADPPWQYNKGTTTPGRTIETHYSTMTLDDIKAMPVEEHTEDNAVLFLWATSPLLPEALDVMRSWGFTYKSGAVWIKKGAPGMGHYFRINHEFLLFGTRGKPGTPEYADRFFSDVHEAPKKRHSEKPALFHEMIERMYPEGPRIELFARRAREGWEVWGNQADQQDAEQPELEELALPRGVIVPARTFALAGLLED